MTADGEDGDDSSGSDGTSDDGDPASMYDRSGADSREDAGSSDQSDTNSADQNDTDSSDQRDSGVHDDEGLAGMYDQSGADSGDGPSVNLDAPVGAGEDEPETAVGTFYVKYATDSSVTLHEIDTAQIFTLIENPGFEGHDILEATLMAQPPMEVSYVVDELHDKYTVPVEYSPEPPTQQVQEVAAEMDEMEAVAIEREGEGEIHVLRVPPEDVDRTAEELHEDEMTHKNAVRYGVERVEIRTDEEGIVSIRYLP